MLMAAMGLRRPTRDIDMQGHGTPMDEISLADLVGEVAAIDVSDGLSYDATTIKTTRIRDGDVYGGVRIQLDASLATGRMTLKLHISAGDPVTAEQVEIPSLIDDGEPVRMAGYPIETVLAEKLVTALQRGTVNTRWRDFGDVHLLIGTHDVAQEKLDAAIAAVAAHRGEPLRPLAPILNGFAAANQARWDKWRRRLALTDMLLEDFAGPVETCIAVFDAAAERIDSSNAPTTS